MKKKNKQTNKQTKTKTKHDSRLLPKLSLPLRQKLVPPMIGKSAVKFIWFQNW